MVLWRFSIEKRPLESEDKALRLLLANGGSQAWMLAHLRFDGVFSWG